MNDDEDAERILRDHLRVDEGKPVSYLPIGTIKNVIGIPVEEYVRMAKGKGLMCDVFSPEETCIKGGAVYVYDAVALQNVLEKNRDILEEMSWPRWAPEFVRRIAKEWLDEEGDILRIIRSAFGDWVERQS